MNLTCPPSMAAHVRKVFQGEYVRPYQHPDPVILDLGANIGGFAAWALKRSPNCFVHCYEPLPGNFERLRYNLRHLEGASLSLNNFAIGDTARTRPFLGKNNCGEASFFNLGEQSAQSVEVVTNAPDVLSRAEILKFDTEGSEIDIVAGMPRINFDVVLLEYHSEQNRRKSDELLSDYLLIGGETRCLHRGVLKYVHRRLFS
jgi:FkbM family methyltransferase